MCVRPLRSISGGTPLHKASFCRPRTGWSGRAFDAAALPLTTRITGSAYRGLHGQAEFRLLSLFRRERRHGDTQEPNASGDRKEWFEQSVAELFELASRPDRDLTGAAARDDPKIGELDLERDGAAANAGALAVVPHFVDDLSKRVPRGFVGEEIGGECVLGADGFAYPIGADGPFVDAARGPVIIGAHFPEMLLQELQGLALEIEPGFYAETRHLPRGGGPDAMKLPDRQGLDERRAHFRGDDKQPVRLAVVVSELGEELVVGDPGRRREPGFDADFSPDFFRDLRRRNDALEVIRDVEIGLVERQRLDDRRILREDFPDLQRDCLVGIEPRLDEDQIGALSLGGDRGHRRMNAKLPCLVACRRDHAALARSANRDRLAAQIRVIALFDGCVESIHVDMDDLARAARLARETFRALFCAHQSPLPLVGQARMRFASTAYRTIANRWRELAPAANLRRQIARRVVCISAARCSLPIIRCRRRSLPARSRSAVSSRSGRRSTRISRCRARRRSREAGSCPRPITTRWTRSWCWPRPAR